jgi:hypothetical protein
VLEVSRVKCKADPVEEFNFYAVPTNKNVYIKILQKLMFTSVNGHKILRFI